MLEPVIEEDETHIEVVADVASAQDLPDRQQEQSLPRETTEIYKRRITRGRPSPISSHPPLSYENTRNRFHRRLISRHNTRARRSSYSLESPITPSWLDLSPSSSSSGSPSLPTEPQTPSTPSTPVSPAPRLSCPPLDPKRLSEEALLYALQNIRIEEEEELQCRRRSLHIVDIPPTPPPETASSTDVSGKLSNTSSTSSSLKIVASPVQDPKRGSITPEKEPVQDPTTPTPENPAPYAECGIHQLVRSKERLRDLEQQLQDTVCMMQDAVELVTRRLGTTSCASGEKPAAGNAQAARIQQAVESMQSQLARLGKAHSTTSTEHALVDAEIKAKGSEEWREEMASFLGVKVRGGQH